MTKFLLFLIVFIASISFTNCGDATPDCKDCNKAIDHFYEKIDLNSCNPLYMENALNTLQEDCEEEEGEIYAYFMAETCCDNNKQKAICVTAGKVKLKADIKVYNNVDLLQNKIIIGYEIWGTKMDTLHLWSNASRIFEDVELTEYDEFAIRIEDVATGTQLKIDYAEFTVVRPGIVCNMREVLITEPTTDNYVIQFINW